INPASNYITDGWTSRPDLGLRWPSRLVATAAEERLSFRHNAHVRLRRPAAEQSRLWISTVIKLESTQSRRLGRERRLVLYLRRRCRREMLLSCLARMRPLLGWLTP